MSWYNEIDYKSVKKQVLEQAFASANFEMTEEQKRKLKPQALRQAKARRQALKKRLNQRDASFLFG